MVKKIAIILFNLGGPDGPEAVQPFLQNLFFDKAIISAPLPIRFFLSRLISRTRAPSAKQNYALMGGGSPLLPKTEKQANALEALLNASTSDNERYKCFIAMRYWQPFIEDVAKEVEAYDPDEVIGLPLYPQYSTTTTQSSYDAWDKAYKGLTRKICCYPENGGLVKAHQKAILDVWRKAGEADNVTLLASAHGLPERTVKKGDPYPDHIKKTAEKVFAGLPQNWRKEICYQSRVGPLKWIGPSTKELIEKYGQEDVTLIVCPIAFVSEHIETLVELDIEYKEVAESQGVKAYLRARTPSIDESFIEGLKSEILAAQVSEHLKYCPINDEACRV